MINIFLDFFDANKWTFVFAFMLLIFASAFAIAADEAQFQQVDTASSSYIFNVTYDDAQDAVGKSLTEKMGADKQSGQSIAAVIMGRKITPLYSSDKPVSVEIRGLRADNDKSSWSANLVIISGENVVSALPISGRYTVMNSVPVLKRAIKNGETIRESDIEFKPFPLARVGGDAISDISNMVGKTPVRVISPARPIRSSEISGVAIVKKNTLVQMRYKTASMEITTTGQALTDGAKGDVIEVRNVSSKKTTRAVVTDDNVVDVMAQGVQTSQAVQPAPAINY